MSAKIDRTNNGFADGAIVIAEFKELKNPLMPQKAVLEEQIAVLERSKTNRLEPLRKWVFEANKAETAVSNDNWLEMKSFLEKVGSNRLLRAQTLTVSFIKSFDSLATTTLAVRSTAGHFHAIFWMVEPKGFEPLTFSLRTSSPLLNPFKHIAVNKLVPVSAMPEGWYFGNVQSADHLFTMSLLAKMTIRSSSLGSVSESVNTGALGRTAHLLLTVQRVLSTPQSTGCSSQNVRLLPCGVQIAKGGNRRAVWGMFE